MAGRSRYDGVDTARVAVDDGQGGMREVAYLLPRAPRAGAVTPMAWHRVADGDRLDLIAANHLGDPTAFWRICDANTALNPDDLVAGEHMGSIIVIPVPEM